MGQKARSSPWNAARQSPARPASDVGGHQAIAWRGWASASAAVGFAWGNRLAGGRIGQMGLLDQETRALRPQPSRGKACDLSPTHRLDRPPAANLDTGATDPCATQRRVRLEPRFPGEGTWPVDGTGDPTLFAAWRLIFDALQGFGRPCCSAANARGSPKMQGARLAPAGRTGKPGAGQNLARMNLC